jgi:hypothetical protein
MPRILVRLTLPEVQLALAQYVEEASGLAVNAGLLEFEYDEDGVLFGALFDVDRMPTPPPFQADGQDAGAGAEANGRAVFSLLKEKSGEEIARGDPSDVISHIDGRMREAREMAKSWMNEAGPGQILDLKNTRRTVAYRLKRVR